MSDRLRVSALGLALAVMAGACDFDIDESANRFPSDALPDVPDDLPRDDGADVAPVERCDCITEGEWYRFTSLYPTSLAGDPRHPLVRTLRNLWTQDIERFELNVMFQVTAIDNDRLTVKAMNAARGELGTGEVCTLPETAVMLDFVRDPVTPCLVRMARPQAINIYAGTPTIPRNCAPDLPTRHAIPVTRIQLAARITPDCSTLEEGVASEAGIPRPDLGRICTCPGVGGPAENCEPIDPAFTNGQCDGCNANFSNLEVLMNAFSGGRDIPTECDDAENGVEGVCIDAAFTAARFGVTPSECGDERITRP